MNVKASPRIRSRSALGGSGRGLPILALLALAALLLPGLRPAPVGAQASQVQYWDNDDVTIAIQPDGTFDVTERQGFVFASGTFNGSFRDIDTSRLTGISNVSVSEDGVGAYRADNTPLDLANGKFGPPRTFQVLDQGGQKRIIWFYGRLTAPARKTMVIKYTVSGGLRYYSQVDQLRWDPFIPLRTNRIDKAQLTVQMPPAVDLTAAGVKASVEPADTGTAQVRGPQEAVFTSSGPLPVGAAFMARLEWPHGLIGGSAAPWQAREDAQLSKYWNSDDVTVQINADSTFDVTERQEFVFTSGLFRGSSRNIEKSRLTGISNVSVSEDGVGAYKADSTPIDIGRGQYGPARTFQVLDTPSEVQIVWFYDEFVAPAQKTMVIHYRVSGGLRFYPGGDQFWWSPFMPNRDGNILHAQLTVQLPPAVNLQDPTVRVSLTPDGVGSAQVSGPQQAVFKVNGTLSPFQAVEARLQWPHGLISGSPPPWQAAFDQEQAQQEAAALAAQQREGMLTLIALALSAIVGVGGVLFWIWLWYTRGRDPAIGPVADYLNAPPSDLPAGLVGVLIDERADVRDVIATILDLGRRGHLRIEEIRVPGGFGGEQSDFQYTWLNSNVQFLFERRVLDALFDSGQNPVRLSDLKNKFYSRLPGIYAAMYQAMIDLKYWPRSPQATRARYGLLAGAFLVGGLLAFCGFLMADLTNAAACLLPFAFGLPALTGFILMFFMARKTALGAEQAARWKAFGRYLADLQRFGNLEEAARRFGDYLPYAVAFGSDQQYVNHFNSVQAHVPMPTYYAPWGWVPVPVPVYGGGQPGAPFVGGYAGGPLGSAPQGGIGPDFGPAGGAPGFGTGGINAMNAGLVGAISGLNTSINSMINDASSVFTSAPRSGGWSGGGGGWSGGGGGGGGGSSSFGGGGSSSSGGGGGGGGGGSF